MRFSLHLDEGASLQGSWVIQFDKPGPKGSELVAIQIANLLLLALSATDGEKGLRNGTVLLMQTLRDNRVLSAKMKLDPVRGAKGELVGYAGIPVFEPPGLDDRTCMLVRSRGNTFNVLEVRAGKEDDLHNRARQWFFYDDESKFLDLYEKATSQNCQLMFLRARPAQ
jgi:hypothetical protein